MSALKATIVSFFLFLAGLFGYETNIGADPRVLQESQGGTGTSTYQLGDIIYASGTNQLGRLPIGSSGQVLEVTGGIPAWATDDTGGGGGSGSIYSGMNWAYIRGGIRNNTSTDQVLIGATATSTLANLEIQGNTTASGSLRGDNFVMTSNTLSSIRSGLIVSGSSTFASSLNVSGNLNASGTAFFGGNLLPGTNNALDIGQYSQAFNDTFVSGSIFTGGLGEQLQINAGSFNAENTLEFNALGAGDNITFSTANGVADSGGLTYTIGNAAGAGSAGEWRFQGGDADSGPAANFLVFLGDSSTGLDGSFIVYNIDESTPALQINGNNSLANFAGSIFSSSSLFVSNTLMLGQAIGYNQGRFYASNTMFSTSGTLQAFGLATLSGGVSTTAFNAQTVSTTVATTSQFFIQGLGDCDDATGSKVLWDATNGRFSCGSDQNSGGAGSSIGVTFDYYTNFLTPSTTIGLAIATSTANQGGLFAVNTSGNISTSGTLEVFGRSRFAGVVNASSTLLVSSSLTVGQGPGYNLGQVHVSSGNIFASGTLDVQGNVYASGSIYATQLSVFQNGIGTGPAGSILTNDGILQLTNSTLNQLDLGSHQFISSGRFNFILDSNNDGSNPLTDKSIFFSSNITDQFNNSGERRLMTLLYPGIILMSNGGADFGGMTGGLHSTTTVSSSLFAFNANSSTHRGGRFRIEANGDFAASGTQFIMQALGAPAASGDVLCYETATGIISHQATNCTVSSIRFKHQINPLTFGLSEILKLEPKEYLRNQDDKLEYGLIAEEVEKIDPTLVIYDADGKPKGVKYEQYITVGLINAIKEQQKQIEELQKRNGVKRDNRELYAILGIGSILILISLRRKYGHGRTH